MSNYLASGLSEKERFHPGDPFATLILWSRDPDKIWMVGERALAVRDPAT